MKLLKTNQVAKILNLTNGQIIELLTKNIIKDAQIIDDEIFIPSSSIDYVIKHKELLFNIQELFDINALSNALHISTDTATLWIKLKKITPDRIYKNKYFFYRQTIMSLMKFISSNDSNALKSRRNKQFKSGNEIYYDYISSSSKNLQAIENLLNIILNEYKLEINETLSNLIISECALQLVNQKLGIALYNPNDLIRIFLYDQNQFGKYKVLFKNLITNQEISKELINNYPKIFAIKYYYYPNEDLLGLLYLSINNLKNRKKLGIYYTPQKLVNRLIANLGHQEALDDKLYYYDPCCGTGNFLINLPDCFNHEHLYGSDLDKIAVDLCRINMLLKYPTISIKELKEHFFYRDYIFDSSITIKDKIKQNDNNNLVVLGNPPWGVNFNYQEKKSISNLYKSVENLFCESFDLFIEKSINEMVKDDILSFIIPETLINVKSHNNTRKIIVDNCQILECHIVGEQFNNVNCPSIIFTLKKLQNDNCETNSNIIRCNGATIYNKNQTSFTINSDREFTNQLDITMNDDCYKLINKIMHSPNCTNLTNKADWALGIVTGNNQKFIEKEKNKNNEPILKGSNIDLFKINYKNLNYINFIPENFQQTAPEELYRKDEKLFYRFISNKLVFSYDNKKTLSLNSANMLIPKIPGINIKYILAILNSNLANYIYQNKFRSVKVLRSHIEAIPIKIISDEEQQKIIKLVNKLMENISTNEFDKIFAELNNKINSLYDITKDEEKLLKS